MHWILKGIFVTIQCSVFFDLVLKMIAFCKWLVSFRSIFNFLPFTRPQSDQNEEIILSIVFVVTESETFCKKNTKIFVCLIAPKIPVLKQTFIGAFR